MTKQQTIDVKEKIKKLLALGGSPNENEAKLAMENANKLLLKHNLTTKDLTNEILVQSSVKDLGKKRVSAWETNLMNIICKSNFCEVLIQRRETVSFLMIGKEINIQASLDMYDYLSNAVISWAKKNGGKGASAKNSYKLGMVNGLTKRLTEIMQESQTNGYEGTTAVVIYDLYKQTKEENWGYIKDNFSVTTSRKKTNVSDYASFSQGQSDSKNINFNEQIRG